MNPKWWKGDSLNLYATCASHPAILMLSCSKNDHHKTVAVRTFSRQITTHIVKHVGDAPPCIAVAAAAFKSAMLKYRRYMYYLYLLSQKRVMSVCLSMQFTRYKHSVTCSSFSCFASMLCFCVLVVVLLRSRMMYDVAYILFCVRDKWKIQGIFFNLSFVAIYGLLSYFWQFVNKLLGFI